MSEQRIKQTTVVEQVMSKIKELISSGEYKPGDKIPTERELSEMFGVGRSSIREAVKIFNYLGILESRTAKGTYVKERSNISKEALTWSLLLGNDDLDEMVDLRGAIELWAMLKLAEGIEKQSIHTKSVIETLEKTIQNMKKAAAQHNKKKLIEYDFQFHRTILTGSGNTLLISLFETLKSFLYDEIEKSQMEYTDLHKIPGEHSVILAALKTGDSLTVSRTYTDHIQNIKGKLQNRG